MSQFLDRVARRPRPRLTPLLPCVVAAALLFPVPASSAPTERSRLTAAEGSAEAKFGTSVSIDGNTAVVAAGDEGGTAREGGKGAAYVCTRSDGFTRSDGIWTEQATLVAPVRRDGDKFGFSVAVDGDTVVVDAPSAEETLPGPGTAPVFVRQGETLGAPGHVEAGGQQAG